MERLKVLLKRPAVRVEVKYEVLSLEPPRVTGRSPSSRSLVQSRTEMSDKKGTYRLQKTNKNLLTKARSIHNSLTYIFVRYRSDIYFYIYQTGCWTSLTGSYRWIITVIGHVVVGEVLRFVIGNIVNRGLPVLN